jgi:hypothetical protein
MKTSISTIDKFLFTIDPIVANLSVLFEAGK